MNRSYRIVHFTSVHGPDDNRIFHKQAKSIAALGYEVLYVAPSNESSVKEQGGVTVITVKNSSSRLGRILLTTFQVVWKAYQQKGDLYHFHDPELILWGILFRIFGKKVIFDVHENYAVGIAAKEWIPRVFKPFLSVMMDLPLIFLARWMNGIVTADDILQDKYRRSSVDESVVSVKNYPIISETLSSAPITAARFQERKVLFLGGIVASRCASEFVDALELLREENFRVYIGGKHNNSELLEQFKGMDCWRKVEFMGRIPVEEVLERTAEASISINLFSDSPNHYDIRSNRLYEAMASGAPVIVSHFPQWKEFIEKHRCGIAVDPHNVSEIAAALKRLLDNPKLCVECGENGREVALTSYRWETEVAKLDRLYQYILSE